MSSQAPTTTTVFTVPGSEFELMNRYPDGFWQRLQLELWAQWDEEKDQNDSGYLVERFTLKSKASGETFEVIAKFTDLITNDAKTTWWFRIFEIDDQQVDLYVSYVTDLPMPERIGLGTVVTEPWPMQR